MEQEKETWKAIDGYEGIYEVSTMGRVKSLKTNRIMKTWQHNCGYENVTLSNNKVKKKYRINRLVGIAFPEICGEYFEGCEYGHKNCNRTDNRAANIYVCTHKENMNHPITRINNSIAHKKKREELN